MIVQLFVRVPGLSGTGRKDGRGMEVGEEVGQGEEGKRGIIYLSLHCHQQNDFDITMGSDESHFNVSLTVRDKVTRLSTNHNF